MAHRLPPPVGRRGDPPPGTAIPRGRRRRPLFCRMGGGAISPGQVDTEILRVDPRPEFQGVCLSFGNEIEPDPTTGLYYWDDGTRLKGAWFSVWVGDSPIDDLGYLNSPWGFIGDRGPIWIPFNGIESVVIRVSSAAATPANVDVCAQLDGAWYAAGEEF